MEFENSWKNHGVLAWDCFLDSVSLSFFSLALLALQFWKHQVFIFEQSNPKPSFLHHKKRFFIFIQFYATYQFLFFLHSIIWLKEGRMSYFEWSWKFNDRSWNYHGKIMEFYFIFSVGTLIVIVLNIPFKLALWSSALNLLMLHWLCCNFCIDPSIKVCFSVAMIAARVKRCIVLVLNIPFKHTLTKCPWSMFYALVTLS